MYTHLLEENFASSSLFKKLGTRQAEKTNLRKHLKCIIDSSLRRPLQLHQCDMLHSSHVHPRVAEELHPG